MEHMENKMNSQKKRIVEVISYVSKRLFEGTSKIRLDMSLCVLAISLLILPGLFSCAHREAHRTHRGLPDFVTVTAVDKVHKVFPESMTDKNFLKLCPSITNVSVKTDPLEVKDYYLLELSWTIKRPDNSSEETGTIRNPEWFLSFNKNQILNSSETYYTIGPNETLSVRDVFDHTLYYVELCSWTDCKMYLEDLEKGKVYKVHLWTDCNNYDPQDPDNMISAAYIQYKTVTIDMR